MAYSELIKNFENIRDYISQFYVYGFKRRKDYDKKSSRSLPKVVFWNVASRNMQSPVEMNEQGVTLVSGCNPRIFSMVMEDKCTPYEYMLDVLNQERYADIKA